MITSHMDCTSGEIATHSDPVRASSQPSVEQVLKRAVRMGCGGSVDRLRFYLTQLVGSTLLRGRRVLDVGGGIGALSFFALAKGAASVTCLEPAAGGSRPRVRERFAIMASNIDPQGLVSMVNETFQSFAAPPSSFDVVLFHNSVNHIDEPACEQLRTSGTARRAYAEYFRRLYELCAPGADVLLSDCSSKNFFPALGLRNPFAPTIEWNLHQPPWFWAELLEAQGFETTSSRWMSFGSLGALGRLTLANSIGAFFTQSQFAVWVRKPA